jgi:hypothetical protein
MSDFSITDIRIDGKRYYAVGKGHDDRVSFYTTNIAAARFWIRSEENDPTYYYYPSIKSHTDHDLLNH